VLAALKHRTIDSYDACLEAASQRAIAPRIGDMEAVPRLY
jgi:hypothetical protein